MTFDLIPPDGGMAYRETNLQHFFPEPFNMVSSALFLIPALYWLIKLKGFDRRYSFLSIVTWLLLIGCTGSTLYHGLRRWRIFIFMDWVPIAIICLMASVYFWIKFTGRQLYGIIAFIVFIGLVVAAHCLFRSYNVQLMISLNYTLMVLMIVLPLFLLLWKIKWHNASLVVLALLSFTAAIGFRVEDNYTSWRIGTHFLWHTFGMIATSLMFVFIYRVNRVKLSGNTI